MTIDRDILDYEGWIAIGVLWTVLVAMVSSFVAYGRGVDFGVRSDPRFDEWKDKLDTLADTRASESVHDDEIDLPTCAACGHYYHRHDPACVYCECQEYVEGDEAWTIASPTN